jgi:polyhydroxyalkanoate synthesis regulator phasin
MSNVLHEVINSGQPWAAERAQYALQIAEALQNGQVSQDEARALLEDLIATEKLEADGADIQLRAALIFGVTQVLSMC